MVEGKKHEMAHYEKHRDYYSYGFYVAKEI